MDVLVDFSGDPGVQGKGVRWLVIAAVADLSNGSLATRLEAVRKKSRYPDGKPISLKGKPHDYKRGVIHELLNESWISFVAAADTVQVRDGSGLAVPQKNINYAMKYVMERASQLAKEIGDDSLTVRIEQAGNFNTSAFRDYIARMQHRPPQVDFMEWSVVDPQRIIELAKEDDHRLSVADVVAHSAWTALTPDPEWGHCEACYLEWVAPRLARWSNGAPLRKGFVFLPTSLQDQYLGEFPDVARLVKPE